MLYFNQPFQKVEPNSLEKVDFQIVWKRLSQIVWKKLNQIFNFLAQPFPKVDFQRLIG